MYCIVGLGNPGAQYSQTRHNAGFLVVDRLIEITGATVRKDFNSLYSKVDWHGKQIFLVKPQTFMNLSGEAVRPLVDYYKLPLDRVVVVYDEMDLPLGALRFRPSGSSGGHKGLTSVIQHLKTDQIARLRVGIGRPPEGMAVPNYVLTNFSGAERPIFEESIAKASEACLAFIEKGLEYTMNHYNVIQKTTQSSPE